MVFLYMHGFCHVPDLNYFLFNINILCIVNKMLEMVVIEIS